METCKVNLDGGDPLTHKHVDEIVQWLTDQGVSTRMNTNGILVPKKIAVIKRLACVKISLDGPREIHDAARGKGAFDKAVAGALAARLAGSKPRWIQRVTCIIVGRSIAPTTRTMWCALARVQPLSKLRREDCNQCWCARTVEGNYKRGGRLDMML